MNTLAQVEAFAASRPRRDNGEPWATSTESWCEAFVHEAGGFTETFATAYKAAIASGPLATDKTIIPGQIYYFSGGSGNPGHDAYGTARGLLMVSSAVPNGAPGYLPSVDAYLHAKPFMTYLGHTARHGTQTLAGTATAAAGQQALDNNPIDPYAQSRKVSTMSDVIPIRGDSPAPAVIGGKNYHASDIAFWYFPDTGLRRWISSAEAGVLTVWLRVRGLGFADIQLPQAQVDSIPMMPGTKNWDGTTVPKAS